MPDASSPEPESSSTARPLLRVEHLTVTFPVRRSGPLAPARTFNAVDDVSLTLKRGETLGLVGESGCGKSTLARAILRLIPASRGRIVFDGVSIHDLPEKQLRPLRREMQVVFQDPAGSLNPHMRIGHAVGEPLLVHGLCPKRDLRGAVEPLLARCGLPADAFDRYPHEFSGGQRQRIAIARAIAPRPRLVVCDEPTSALDVSVQSHILNLLADLRDEFGLAYLFISHDMAVVHHFCDHIAVMKDGRIVERGDRERIIRHPQHDYTRALLAAVPRPDPAPPADDDPRRPDLVIETAPVAPHTSVRPR